MIFRLALCLLLFLSDSLGSHDSITYRTLPTRLRSALTGSEFVTKIGKKRGLEREALIQEQLEEGNMPDFVRTVVPVNFELEGVVVTLWVTPRYLAIGSNTDYVYIPVSAKTTTWFTLVTGFSLPTKKIVDLIHKNADVKVSPIPLDSADLTSTNHFVLHSALVRDQLKDLDLALISGTQKDIVISARLCSTKRRVAIYGWHRNNRPIQPLSIVHDDNYSDYSHGVRLVYPIVGIGETSKDIRQILKDPKLASLLSDEGPLTCL